MTYNNMIHNATKAWEELGLEIQSRPADGVLVIPEVNAGILIGVIVAFSKSLYDPLDYKLDLVLGIMRLHRGVSLDCRGLSTGMLRIVVNPIDVRLDTTYLALKGAIEGTLEGLVSVDDAWLQRTSSGYYTEEDNEI